MPLVNMKRAEVEQKGETLLGEPVDASKEDYYYGLTINLEEPELQKLGIEEPKVGGMISLQAVGKLVMYSKDDKRGRRAEIQLQSLGVADKPQEEARSDVLYPKVDS